MSASWVVAKVVLVVLAAPLVATATVVGGAEAPVAVSPGRADLVVEVAATCPTFSWAFVQGVPALQLEVWRLAGDEASHAERVIALELVGAATSWTPDAASCPTPGATYAWRVGGVDLDGTVAWSEPSWFFLPETPGRMIVATPGEPPDAVAAVGPAALVEAVGSADGGPGSAAPGQVPARARSATFFSVGNGGAVSAGAVAAGSFAGDGAAITNLDAGQLTAGTVPAGRLSGEYAIDISGTAADVAGVVAVVNGGTGAGNAAAARASLGAAAVSHGHAVADVAGLSEALVEWVEVLGTSQQAAANTGYIASLSAEVTVTLPLAPAVGDVVRVAGAGAGGWRIAHNPGQSTDTRPLGWKPRETHRQWFGVAISADGSRVVAVVRSGQILTSSDFGVSWVSRESSRNWHAVASSADGSRLVAADFGGRLYTSDDFGATWTPRESSRNWRAVASSADGSRLLAGVDWGQLYVSADYGATWTPSESTRYWYGVASSADGSKLAAVARNGQVFTSSDFGATWTANEANRSWFGIASSTDGVRLAAVAEEGQIYISSDSGSTWAPRESRRSWRGIASSADGSRLAALANFGRVYTSTDFGATWRAEEGARQWYCVASSGDGRRLAAGVDGGMLYTYAASTASGPGAYLRGEPDASVELLHVGGGLFRLVGVVGGVEAQ